ncbi:MAG: CHRD domain-containing protein [Candidatus Marinimicrobia bacterium]|nr:CHRD domain-containing protein [Candidatus Neomarinimicrobiota bacterium]
MNRTHKLFTVVLGILFSLSACNYSTAPQDSAPTYSSSLSGGNIVPMPIRSSAIGNATISLNRESRSLSYEIKVDNNSGYVTTLICCGSADENGKPSVSLGDAMTTNRDQRGDCWDLTMEGSVEECFFDGDLTGKTLEDFQMMVESGQMYVNIITTKYPDGELRGQLR